MKRISLLIAPFVLTVSSLFVLGCGPVFVQLDKKEFTKVTSLKVVRHPTPEIGVSTFWRQLLGGSIPFVFAGPLGAGAAGETGFMIQGKLDNKIEVLDFGLMIENKLVETLPREIPNWPSMDVQMQPIAEDFSGKDAVLEIKVERMTLAYLGVFDGNGLITRTVATIKDSNGNILWKTISIYGSGKFNRGRSMDEFQADGGKLLREEVEFAVQQTVIDLIEQLKEEG